MRLFLTCLGIDGHPEHLVAVTGADASIGVVLHAIDDRPDDHELAWQVERDELARIGLRPELFDLRRADGLRRLETIDALWVRGGNTFLLRAAMAAAGADTVITRRILDGSLGYAGYSAGAAVLAPDLVAVAQVDDPDAVTGLTGGEPIFSGLGILDRPLIPHVGSPTYDDGIACTALHERLDSDGIVHHALRDGDALVTSSTVLHLIPRR